MKVLITGGGGFLGYRLAQAILKKGTLADAEGNQKKVSESVVFDLAFPENTDPRFQLVKGSLTDLALIEKTMKSNTDSINIRCVFYVNKITTS